MWDVDGSTHSKCLDDAPCEYEQDAGVGQQQKDGACNERRAWRLQHGSLQCAQDRAGSGQGRGREESAGMRAHEWKAKDAERNGRMLSEQASSRRTAPVTSAAHGDFNMDACQVSTGQRGGEESQV